jgi:protein-S-isoprenylcysteine O-methyltransferase Ste14
MDMSNPPVAPPRPPRPASAVSTGVGVSGMFGLLCWMAVARWYGMDGPSAAITNLLCCAVPMVVWSLVVDKVHRNPSTGLDWATPATFAERWEVSTTKLCGLWATWIVIGVAYCLGRWFWTDQYRFAMNLFEQAAPWLFALSIPYIYVLDRYLINPRDGAWHVGQWLMGQPGWDKVEIAHHARAWTVKGLFIAFMFSILPLAYAEVIATPFASVTANPAALTAWLISFMFVIDIAFATVGYLLTIKPLDAHIRTANPFLAGWVAALMCYPPFGVIGNGAPLDYGVNGQEWSYWLDGQTALLWIVGALLVVLTGLYAWATMIFGLRFSNLTYRGVMTHGPYAWTKHPAYLFKNSFWWVSSMPFLATTHSIVDMARNSAMLVAIGCLYYWRAKTEEKHLSQEDPIYRAYADWMDEYGPITRRINKLLRRTPKRLTVLAP